MWRGISGLRLVNAQIAEVHFGEGTLPVWRLSGAYAVVKLGIASFPFFGSLESDLPVM
jgi:hypothetical protein